MLGKRRRSEAGGIHATIDAQTIAGPTAIGDHIVQYVAGGDLSISEAPHRAVPRPRPRPVALLPRDFARLEGRSDAIARAVGALGGGEPVELVGGDGAGKSVLLRHLVHRPEGIEASDGIAYADVAGQPLDDVLAQAFEAFFTWDEAALPTRAQIVTELSGLHALVVFDDLGLDREDVGRVLNAIPQSAVAFSGPTRRCPGEADGVELSGVDVDVAVRLFERALGDEVAPPPQEEVRALCGALRGRPLLVVQAADLLRAGRVSWAQLRDAVSPEDVAELRDHGYADDELRALAPLLALPDIPLAPGTAAAITGHPQDAATLDRLRDEGIVRRASPRYRFVGEPSPELTAQIDVDAWRTRALEAMAGAGAVPSVDDGPLVAALLSHGMETQRFDLVLTLARRADPVLALAGRWGAWSVVLGQALAAGEASGDAAAVAWAQHQLGTAAVARGDHGAAIAHLTSALQARERLGDHDGARRTADHLRQARGEGPPAPTAAAAPPRYPSWLRWPALAAVAGIGALVGVLIGQGSAPATPDGGVVTHTTIKTKTVNGHTGHTVTHTTTIRLPPSTVTTPGSTVQLPGSTVTLPPVTTTTTTTTTVFQSSGPA